MANVMMSNGLEKGPRQIMNRTMDQALHVLGRSRYSGSTLSLSRISVLSKEKEEKTRTKESMPERSHRASSEPIAAAATSAGKATKQTQL